MLWMSVKYIWRTTIKFEMLLTEDNALMGLKTIVKKITQRPLTLSFFAVSSVWSSIVMCEWMLRLVSFSPVFYPLCILLHIFNSFTTTSWNVYRQRYKTHCCIALPLIFILHCCWKRIFIQRTNIFRAYYLEL